MLLHLILGIFIGLPFVSSILSIGIVFFGVIIIIKQKNDHQEAVLFSAYLVGSEVLFRMSGGAVLHELTKYAVMVFLVIGMIVESKKHHVNPVYLLYLMLLLVGIAFTDVPFSESIRNAVAFNLSGPFALGVAAMYFYNRKILLDQLLRFLFYMSLPVLTMLSYLFLKTPAPQEIVFGTQSNFEASGGFGPNQVATILGIGFFILAVHILLKKEFSGIRWLDLILLIYIFYRTLLTFSRGGLYTVLVALGFFAFFILVMQKNRIKNVVKYGSIIGIMFIAVWLFTSNVTGGMLENRMMNMNALGEYRSGDVTTGRADIFAQELESFYENPFFGIGVGSSKFHRMEITGKEVASHNEMSRLLSEHGGIGLIILGLLILVPLYQIKQQSYLAKAFLSAFFVIWFLTINHSAMRVALPAFFYGLSTIQLMKKDSELT